MVKYLLWSNSFSGSFSVPDDLVGCDLSAMMAGAASSNTDLMMGDSGE